MQDLLFYSLSFLILLTAVCVILVPNPLVAALSLAGSMVSLAFLFFALDAHFIGAVQLAVYAGAVMILFVMVLMLFDLGKDVEVFSGGKLACFLKVVSGFTLLGVLTGAILTGVENGDFIRPALMSPEQQMMSVQTLAQKIFTQYLFAFEILGLLLLLIAVGVVAVSRIKGGTHAK